MLPPRGFSVKGVDPFFLALSFLVLAACIYYFYLFWLAPDIKYQLRDTDWIVTDAQPCAEKASCLQVGDRVLRIGDVEHERYLATRTAVLYRDFFEGRDEIEIELIRHGDTESTTVKLDRPPSRHLGGLIHSWFFPFLVWLCGTLAVIFLRPRDQRWLILVFFHYVTALWSAAGAVSSYRIGFSELVFHAFIWLFLPLTVHLHLILPSELSRQHHRWLLPPLYLAATALLILDLRGDVDLTSYQLPVLFAFVISIGLLVFRLFLSLPPAVKVANRLMLFGVGLGLGPWFVFLIMAFQISPPGTSFLSDVLDVGVFLMPMWPLAYIFALHRYHLGNVEFRANRLFGLYGFLSLCAMAYVTIFLLFSHWQQAPGQPSLLVGLLAFLVFVAVAQPLRRGFQRLVDRHIFGIKYSPAEVVGLFAERIPSANSRRILRRVIGDEILPTLLIRQSALYLYGETVETIYEQNVSEGFANLGASHLERLTHHAGRHLPGLTPGDPRDGWIRLVVPLAVPDRTIGVWLLGRRDPDDFYSRSDVDLLTRLANQMAPVIENFRLVEQAQAEVEENRRLHEQLLHSQKMEAVGRLSAGVAHDFNNLLAIILSHTDLLLVKHPHDAALRRNLDEIIAASEKATALTRQLLAFSHQQKLEPKIVDLNSVVSDVTKMLRRITGEDVELVTVLAPNLPNVRMDPGQMSQVIINLAVNARDAMPEGGQLTIATRSLTCGVGNPAATPNLPPGEYVLMTVTDTGAGIDPDVQPRVFEPFFTTKEVGQGTGLGLSVVFGIVKQSEGYIFVDSSVGEGSTFSLYLPAVREPETEDKVEAAFAAPPLCGSETILLVEDEDNLRAVANAILTERGYTVMEARNGFEGLEVSARHEGRIDLLLTDVVMPKMKGPELAERLTGIRPELKVLYMSGYNDESMLGENWDRSGAMLLSKPFTLKSLTRTVREVLDGAPRSTDKTC